MDLHNRNESSSSPFELQSLVPSVTARNNEVEDDRNSQLQNSLKEDFLKERTTEIDDAFGGIRNQHPFPLARIRRIAKSNEKVERIGASAIVLLAKACEFFVMELTSQAWFNKQENTHLTLQHWDIGRALSRNNRMNFLDHIVRANSQKESMRHLKETMFRPAYPPQLQNSNPDFLLGNQEIPQLFSASTSSVPLNCHPGFKDLLLGNQEIPQLFSPSTSSVPLNNHPGFKDLLLRNQEIPQLFSPSTSSVPLNNHPGFMDLLLGNQEIPQLFSPSTSSVPLNYQPGFMDLLLGNQEIPQLFSPSTSSVPLNYHPGSKEEPSERSS